jgi:OOP family OmpA-OmpF porin
MKKIKLLFALLMLGNISYAGGEFTPLSSYEEEEIAVEETPVEPIPQPVIVKKIVVTPPPPPPPVVKDIYANGFYAGLGITAVRYKPDCSCPTNSGIDKTMGVVGRVGYDFNKYIGLEARGIRTNWKADGGKVKHAGIFVKPMLPVSDKTNIYGLVGVAKTTTESLLRRTDAESLALGAGVEFDLSEDKAKEGRYNRAFDGQGDQEKGLGVFADYERMVVKSGAPDLDALSVGLTYDF